MMFNHQITERVTQQRSSKQPNPKNHENQAKEPSSQKVKDRRKSMNLHQSEEDKKKSKDK